MKYILTSVLFISSQLFANYAFSNEETVKIDMHGGNSEKYTKQSGFSQMMGKGGLKDMGSMGIKKPSKPTLPNKVNIPKIKNMGVDNDKK